MGAMTARLVSQARSIRHTALLGAFALLGGAAFAEAPGDVDVRTVILLAEQSPVFLRVQMQVDDGTIFKLRSEYASKLFKQRDADGNGVLSPAEQVENAGDAPPDGAADLTSEQFAEKIARDLGPLLSVSLKAARAAQSLDLLPLLDLDRDGRMSLEEMARGPQTLRPYDYDDDETASVPELQPFTGTLAGDDQSGAPLFLALESAEERDRAADDLFRRYRDPEADAVLGDRLNVETIEADRRLSRDDLRALLDDPPAHLELLMSVRHRVRGRTRLAIVKNALGSAGDVTPKGERDLTLALSSVDVKLQARSARGEMSDNTNFFAIKFIMADGDRNGYLNMGEFGAVGLDGTFEAVDRNGDGMVVRNEVVAHVEQGAIAAQSRVSMLVAQEGLSLFELIDHNNDLRLSRREFMQPSDKMLAADRNGDGMISQTELAGEVRVSFSLGKPRVFEEARTNRMGMQQQQVDPRFNETTEGPMWYRKMDHNRDQDVSQREFLGTIETFHQIDADANGLVSKDEAIAYQEAHGGERETEAGAPE